MCLERRGELSPVARGKPTSSVRRTKEVLRYRNNPSIRTSVGIVRPDLTFPGQKVAVFVDGCFWHSRPLHGSVPGTNRDYRESKLNRNRDRDHIVTTALAADGWTVIRVWEHESLADAAKAVESAVRHETTRAPAPRT